MAQGRPGSPEIGTGTFNLPQDAIDFISVQLNLLPQKIAALQDEVKNGTAKLKTVAANFAKFGMLVRGGHWHLPKALDNGSDPWRREMPKAVCGLV